MPFVDVDAGEWTEIVVTDSDTVVQNRSPAPMYFTTEDTTGLPLDEGFEVAPGEGIVFTSGKTVSAISPTISSHVFYMEV